MLMRPQPYEAEAVTHEAETHEAEFEAKFVRQQRLEKLKNFNGSFVKTRRHVQHVRNWINYRTKRRKLSNSKYKLNNVWWDYTFLKIRHYGRKCKH